MNWNYSVGGNNMEFHARITHTAGLNFGERNRGIFLQFMKKNPGLLLLITPMFPESKKQRAYLEGAIFPLVTYYQENLDHHEAEDVRAVREWLKQEFNGKMITVDGRQKIVAQTTRGRENLQPFLEKVVTWLMDNYSPPQEALDPKNYKQWRDTVMPTEGPENYIDYLVQRNILK